MQAVAKPARNRMHSWTSGASTSNRIDDSRTIKQSEKWKVVAFKASGEIHMRGNEFTEDEAERRARISLMAPAVAYCHVISPTGEGRTIS